ncbi:MAG: hypothetical protein M3Y87_33920 [Myxococcota bacterium]|nr:hypothetical protein [Myxococcota bacterium]
MIHRLRSGLGPRVSSARRAAFLLGASGVLALAALGCAPNDRYVQCDTAADCGTYEVDDETWSYACVTIETATTRGSFCTRECARSCGAIGGYAARCFRFEGDDDSFCYQRCERDEDCYPSSRCVEAVGDDGWRGTLCLPDQR